MRATANHVPIDVEGGAAIWERFFTVSPLVIVGSRADDGTYNFAPKNMAGPLGWDNYFAFVCTPRHTTYRNIVATEEFTVSFPRPSQIVLTSLAASPRTADDAKPAIEKLPSFPAHKVDGRCLEDSYVSLECKLDRVAGPFGVNELIVGRIVAAHADPASLRASDLDDGDLLYRAPPLAYLAPGRYALLNRSSEFPFPAGYSR